MNCPKCADFMANSEIYVQKKIGTEIAALANKLAEAEATTHCTSKAKYFDFYIMFYRIFYTQLYDDKQVPVYTEFDGILGHKYKNHPQLCTSCKTDTLDFLDAKFCFHGSGESCTNCGAT
jgi:hypothetical protein